MSDVDVDTAATSPPAPRPPLQAWVVRFGPRIVAAAVVLVVAQWTLGFVHASTSSGRWQTPFPAVVFGVITGMAYGLLAVGLVVIHRTNRIINFAHGEIGAFAAAFFGIEVVRWHIPYWVGFPVALALAGAVGAAAELAVIRKLRRAPKIMSVVATLGVGQFLVLLASSINSKAQNGAAYPQPAGFPVFNFGSLRITQAYSGILVLAPLLAVALAVFFKRSRFGLGIRGAAANPEAARMAGIFSSRMSTLAWTLAGILSAFTAILTQPSRGFNTGGSVGPDLLLKALACAVIAGMESIPTALAAGIAVGVVEQLISWNYPRSGLFEVTLFVLILGVLLLQRRRGGRDDEKGSWAAVDALRPLPDALLQVWTVRNLGRAVAVAGLAAGLLLPLFIANSSAVTMTALYGVTIVGMSVGVLTGLGGQLTLGQFAVAATGATASAFVAQRTSNYPLSFLYAGMVAAVACLLVGLPSLRIRGLMLTVTTLSFALMTPTWLLRQSWMLGGPGGGIAVNPGRPTVFHHVLRSGRAYYLFGLAVLVLTMIVVRNIRRSGFARLLVSIRDNEDNARAFTVRSSLVKVQGYLLAGFIAGIGGALYGHALSSLGAGSFPTQTSIDVVTITVIGGVSMLSGPLLGALLVIGVPAFVPLQSAGLAASSFGQLLIIVNLPGGLAQLVEPLRNRVAGTLARWGGVDVAAAYAAERGAVPATAGISAATVDRDRATSPVVAAPRPRLPGSLLLEGRGLRKSFGGVHAVRGVDIDVRAGEIVGLIGPNGAGKTTTFELLGGFTRLDAGHVVFDGRDVTALGPEARGRLGLIRSFQDAALFPTLTVEETVQLAFERVAPTRFVSAALGEGRRERAKRRRAAELIAFMGLERYRRRQIQELSTGTRRITEIACLIALEPTLLLLDEPSSGIAQRETEALGTLLRELKAELDVAMVVIEHDIPLIMGLSDRIVAMADGVVIAQGSPADVRAHPAVVESYLGGSVTAIERSGG
jgi:ABC-type branched-subunit amino acid transport system ATPase component/ABC-type branched-subunit amino acid transport system permease subunit